MFREPFHFGARGELRMSALQTWADQISSASIDDNVPPAGALDYKPFVASRATFMKEHAHVDIAPLLQPAEAACLLEPRLLVRSPEDSLPVLKSGGKNEKSEILQYIRQWDNADRLVIFPTKDVPVHRRMPLLAVPKTSEVDRTVHNRQGQNVLEYQLGTAVHMMVTGDGLVRIAYCRWRARFRVY